MAAKAKGIDDVLRAAIKASGRTQYAVAKEAGISPEQVYRFIAGTHDLRMATAAKVAKALGMELVKAK